MAGNTSVEQALNDLKEDSAKFFDDFTSALGVRSTKTVSPSQFMALRKEEMSQLLHRAMLVLEDVTTVITTDFEMAPNCVKGQMFQSEQKIVKLQSDLIECRNEQLESFKTVVVSTVGESVEAETKSYSSALQRNLPQLEPSVTAEELKKAVQTVVQEEDRGRNVMIFNLPEQEGEEINTVVAGVFEAIGEKPRVEACRIGKRKSTNLRRPVKVTFSNSTVVTQILSKTKNLRKVNDLKSVFVCPDRSAEQRAKQKLLVTDLKRLAREQTDKKHFIRNGEIVSVDKK